MYTDTTPINICHESVRNQSNNALFCGWLTRGAGQAVTKWSQSPQSCVIGRTELFGQSQAVTLRRRLGLSARQRGGGSAKHPASLLAGVFTAALAVGGGGRRGAAILHNLIMGRRGGYIPPPHNMAQIM